MRIRSRSESMIESQTKLPAREDGVLTIWSKGRQVATFHRQPD